MKKIISILLITIFISTFTLQSNEVFAKDNQVDLESTQNDYVNGNYEVSNEVLKIDSDEVSAARKYVDDKSSIQISNDGIIALVNFNQRNLMTDITVKADGEEIQYTSKEEGDTNLQVIIPLKDLSSNIEVSSVINTGFFKMSVSFRLIFDTSSIPLKDAQGSKPESDSSNGDNSDSNNNQNGNSESENVVVESIAPVITPSSSNTNYSIYKVQNEIITSSSIGYAAARAAISTNSYVEKYDNDVYVTLGISQLDVMNNIRIAVNGTRVSYEIIRQNISNYTMDIRFKVNSISDDIKVTAYINAIEMDISFGLDLLEDTMEIISKSEASTSLANTSSTNVTFSNLSADNSEANLDSEGVSEDVLIEMKSYYKKYTIENEIVSDSAIGRSMARKYIDKICILDEIDGQYYLTIKISSSNAMSNIKIEVNGQEVKYQVVSKDNDGNMAIKFKIDGVGDDIKMKMLINSVNKNVEFGIKLLEDTMILIDEGMVSENSDKNNRDEILENFISQSTSNNGNNKNIVMISSATTMGIIFLIEGIVFAVVKRRKKLISKE